MINNIKPEEIPGLSELEVYAFQRLIRIYNRHAPANAEKDKYYEGKISLDSVNLGIALPDGLRKLEIGCAWGAKTVDVLAARSMFDGFVGVNGEDVEELDRIVVDNRLVAEYMKAARDELKYGSAFATVLGDPGTGSKIRFHSAESAAAEWDGDLGRIAYGMAIIETLEDGPDNQPEPSIIHLHLDNEVVEFRRSARDWIYTRHPHKMGRPLMEPLTWNATNKKPLGRSRIKEPVRRLIQGYVRTIANATIGLEFSTSPQKYLLGVTDEQYDALINQKFTQYVGSMLAATSNPDTGEKPTFGQLQQGTIAPHVEMVRMLATQFSAATGLTVTDTGVVNDANPSSSDAILAQSQTLVAMAEQLNTGNGDALRTIALMALAVRNDTTIEGLSEEQRSIIAHFRNPAMPSVAVTADAALKIATVRPGFAGTDTFLEMVGFDKADIRRIRAQEQLSRGDEILAELGI